jgi:hypothetical protein
MFGNPAFQDLFANSFQQMILVPGNEIDVSSVIDAIESLDTDNLELKYPHNASTCTITLSGSRVKVFVTTRAIIVSGSGHYSPNELIETFKALQSDMRSLAGGTLLKLR